MDKRQTDADLIGEVESLRVRLQALRGEPRSTDRVASELEGVMAALKRTRKELAQYLEETRKP